MKNGKILAIGPQAIDSEEKILIFFGEQATTSLRKYSIIQEISGADTLEVKKGSQILFGEQAYEVTYVGNVANHILQTLEHVTFLFSEKVPEQPLSSGIYLSPAQLPKIEVGMPIIYQ